VSRDAGSTIASKVAPVITPAAKSAALPCNAGFLNFPSMTFLAGARKRADAVSGVVRRPSGLSSVTDILLRYREVCSRHNTTFHHDWVSTGRRQTIYQ
jgi:hypothetical protein